MASKVLAAASASARKRSPGCRTTCPSAHAITAFTVERERWPLLLVLQHHVVPLTPAQVFLDTTVGEVFDEAGATGSFHDGVQRALHTRGGGQLGNHLGHVVEVGMTVSDEQHPQGVRGWWSLLGLGGPQSPQERELPASKTTPKTLRITWRSIPERPVQQWSAERCGLAPKGCPWWVPRYPLGRTKFRFVEARQPFA